MYEGSVKVVAVRTSGGVGGYEAFYVGEFYVGYGSLLCGCYDMFDPRDVVCYDGGEGAAVKL